MPRLFSRKWVGTLSGAFLALLLTGCPSPQGPAPLASVPQPPPPFNPPEEIAVPLSHPRIWWTFESLEAARAAYALDPRVPRAYDDYEEIVAGGWMWNNEVAVENALRYLFTGDPKAARNAVAWAFHNLDETRRRAQPRVEPDGSVTVPITSDGSRWWIQEVICVYDWCYSALTDAERARFIQGLDEVVGRWNAETAWGTPEEPASNYNQGYTRNSFLWGVASLGESHRAREFIDHVTEVRWPRFQEYFRNANPTGIPSEGTSYGHTLLSYFTVMFRTSQQMGYPLHTEAFFERAVYFTNYHTLPSPSYPFAGEGDPSWMVFPFGDSEALLHHDPEYSPVVSENFVEFMEFASRTMPAAVAGTASLWLEIQGRQAKSWRYRYDTPRTSPEAAGSLPLDYVPPVDDAELLQGFVRDSVSGGGTAIHFQFVAPAMGGHEHRDGLNFQIWKAGRFLVPEVPGRGYGSNYRIPSYDVSEALDVEDGLAHNTILFGGEGQTGTGTGRARLLRLGTRPEFFYAAVDGSAGYRSTVDDPRYGNASAGLAVREYLFLRDQGYLLVLDRVESADGGPDLRKSVVFHLLGTVTSAGRRTTSVNGGQAVDLYTLVPASAALTDRAEGGFSIPLGP